MANATESSDDLIVGLLYTLLPIVFSIPYCFILVILYKESKNAPCYKIMWHIGVADLIQLAIHFISGIFTICQSTGGEIINKLNGAVACGSYMSWVALMLLLAFNLVISVCLPTYESKLFGASAVKILIGLCWFWGVAFVAAYSSPNAEFLYHTELYTWDYGSSATSQFLKGIDFWVILIEMTVISICYGTVIAHRLKTRTELQNNNIYASIKKEIALVVQSAILLLYTMFMACSWHFFPLILPQNKWSYMLINTIWIGNSCVNTIVYLTLNKTIREKMVSFLLQKDKVVPIKKK